MNRQEIEKMMRDLPSQRQETLTEKIMVGLAFVMFLAIICLM
jgi:hypothetical protein